MLNFVEPNYSKAGNSVFLSTLIESNSKEWSLIFGSNLNAFRSTLPTRPTSCCLNICMSKQFCLVFQRQIINTKRSAHVLHGFISLCYSIVRPKISIIFIWGSCKVNCLCKNKSICIFVSLCPCCYNWIFHTNMCHVLFLHIIIIFKFTFEYNVSCFIIRFHQYGYIKIRSTLFQDRPANFSFCFQVILS